ncbi:MAG TPA: glycosyltransferase, partial [Candidatus Kryptonia bacterium]|nr:glycosyltransferase [Candidatus Kryptonia bacterium]
VPVRIIGGSRSARVRTLRRQLATDQIDVVHAWLFIANAYAWLATRGTGRPLVTSARNCKRQGWLLDTLNRRAFAASAAIVVNSQEVARYIGDAYRAPSDRTMVIYNAIDTDRFHPATPVRNDEPCVVMIGRLVPQKNPSLFVAAAARLRQQLPSVRFRIIGAGPLRAKVEAEIAAAGLRGCCEVLGERHDVPELLRAADLLWLTSDWEGLPNVVLEAMASGVPLVATDVGGTRELVRDGEGGFVIPAGDRDALVARSLSLLRDGEVRYRFGVAARKRAEAFAPERMADAMRTVYLRAREVQR